MPFATRSNAARPAAILARLLCGLALLSLLAACGTGGPRKRIFPPSASIQELRVLDDGRWQIDLRVQNFSTVPMRFERVRAELNVADEPAASIDHGIADSIPPNSAEVVRVELSPSAVAAAAVQSALESRRGIGYRLDGQLSTSEPKTRDDRFEFSGALTPMPGLDGVLR